MNFSKNLVKFIWIFEILFVYLQSQLCVDFE